MLTVENAVSAMRNDFSKIDFLGDVEFIVSEVCSNYMLPERFYHNLFHAFFVRNKSVELAEEYVKECSEKQLIEVAVAAWMHDYIYEAGASDNEQKSAEAFSEMFQSASNIDICLVYDMVVATKTHKSVAGTLASCLMDADMFQMGSSWEVFSANEEAIRKEYNGFNDAEWFEGRTRFLNSVLETKIFANVTEREQQAKANVMKAIKELAL